MTTTQTWLNGILANPEKLTHWLKRQFIGEVTAAKRIRELNEIAPEKFKSVITRIADDEAQHSFWIGELLIARGVLIPAIENPEARYWQPILGELDSFEMIAASGYHAEGMRLIRIRALASDERVDADIREVFAKILPDEEFHEKAFKAMTSTDQIETTRGLHELGLEKLGLEV
jgi:hypothetical protein